MECLPTANPLYSRKANGLKTEFHAAFEIEYKVDDPNLKWRVHLGDVVAFSYEPLTAELIQEFTPNHYLEPSPHWKIGLVTLLKQEQSPKSQSISIQLRILEKSLNTPFARMLGNSFRPCTKNNPKSKLPHLLVKTEDYQIIAPNQVLPLRITMLSRDEFQDGVDRVETEDNLNLKFHVAKEFAKTGKPTLINTKNPDIWVQLNPGNKGTKKMLIPEALQEAWRHPTPSALFQELPELLSRLVLGYKNIALASKREQSMRDVNQKWKSSEEEGDKREDNMSDDQKETRTSKKKQSNKRRTPSSKQGSRSKKRVRIQTPDEENANPNNASSKPTSTTTKAAPTKQKHILADRKRKTTSPTPKKKPDESTASTLNVTTSPTPRASPKPRTRKFAEVKFDESCLLRRMHKREYYSELKQLMHLDVFALTAKVQPENSYLDISVGQIVAVRVEGMGDKSTRYNQNNITKELFVNGPEQDEAIQWSPAQVVSAFSFLDKKKKKKWQLQVRWFFRLEELKQEVQQELLVDKSFACTSQNLSNSRVIESMTLDFIDLETVLPIHVQVSSSTTATKLLEFQEDGLPLVRLACKHLLPKKGPIVSVENDWDNYQDHLGSLPKALQRGVEQLPKTLEAKTVEWIQEVYGDDSDSNEESEDNESVSSQSAVEGSSNDDQEEASEDENDQEDFVDTQPLEVSSLASKPLYDRWDCQFHDGVRVDVDRDSLVRSFSPKTRQWTVKVGFVVPVRLSKESISKEDLKSKKSYWHPFVEPWLPAQVVSIYKRKTTNEWMMQVRWFNRFSYLLPRQKDAVKNFGKPYVVFETEEYSHLPLDSVFPGRVIMTSSDVDSWAVETSFLTGLPLIPRLCGHICLDEEIDSARDWTNYDLSMKSMPQPLSRGLMLDPSNRENKNWILMLSRYYKAAIIARGMDPDESSIKKWEGVKGRPLDMDSEEYDDSTVQISAAGTIFSPTSSPGLQFFGKLSLIIPSQNLVEPSKVEKRSKEYVFFCKVGDIVCFYDAAAAPRADYVVMKHLKHLWHPYRLPWCFGQILSIHNGSETGSLRVEVRRFLRHSDLPSIVQIFAPSASDSDREELFESDVVLEVPASHLLGTADIFFSGFEKAASMNEPSSHEKSLVSFRCKYFFQHKAKIIQPIVGSSFTPGPWFRECRSRSLQFSTWTGKYNMLHKESTPISPRLTGATVVDLLGSASKTPPKSMVQLESSTPESTMYLETKIDPNWAKYQDCGPIDSSRGAQWKIQVGDFVAVQSDEFIGNSSIDPFNDSWTAAQILAIFMHTDTGMGLNTIKEQLRIQVRHLKMKEVAEDEIPFVEPLESFEPVTIRAEDLLGPLLVCRHGSLFDDVWKKAQQLVPSIPCWGKDSLYTSFEKSLENSTLYTSDGINEVLSKIDDQHFRPQRAVENDSDPDKGGVAWTPSKPFHIDLSQLRTFYENMKLIPPRQMYAMSAKDEDLRESWTVQMGDVVLIRCEGARRYPMDCSWSVAEIVTIFKDFDSTDALETDQHKSGDRAINAASLRVEIRWLYERHDLKRHRTETEASGDYEEVFESDHVDVVDGEDILCPAKLFSDASKFIKPESFRGIPVNQYVCKRFWSTKRKSLIPCGKLEGRQERGWLYSKNFPQEAQDKYSASNLQGNGTGGRDESTVHTWHENMNRVISKLTLLDASTGAYERGEGLIGREKELNELLSFFHAAIRGTAGTGGVKSSLFLAGSPGVGKTACVRAALAQLRKEQSTGTIPKFNLISLNGMELRHPFEAYGKFWEALTGLKHVGTHEAAAARLTRYFTSPMVQVAKQNNPVTVLLLDEIDYLMTEKQTVLYDFFDWPKRAAELRLGRRLVVVGISNTLNLADQLLQSVRSRLGSENKLLFKSYDLKQTIAILDGKMKEASPGMQIFDKDAILLASKKTAGLSGDIRKVFKICRDAAKLVLRRWEESDSTHDSTSNFPTVRIGDVQKASLQSLETALKVAVSFSSPYQALLLISIASLKRATGREGNFDIKDIMMKMEAISGACGQAQYSPPPSFARTMDLLTILAERGLVCLMTARSTMVSFRANKGGSGGAWPLVSLMVGEDQLSHGLKRTCHKELCEKNIPSY